MVIPADAPAEPDYLELPDAPAVCIFESPEQRTLLLATTASARDLARRRLGSLPADERTSRANLRAICGRVHAIRVGSSLEADAVYLHQARARLPHLAKIVAERWRAWFVHVDPDAEFPQWTKTNLMIGLVGKRSASTSIGGGTLGPGILLGPLADKDAAGRLIEAIIDCFDLCRYHHLLVRAPHASACAYKEMGRCPAPCDGSEEMQRYRHRTAAASLSICGVSASIDRAGLAMQGAAASGDFVEATKLQKDIARLRTLDTPAFAQVRALHEWRELFVLPGVRKGRAAIVLFDRGVLYRVEEFDPREEGAAAGAARAAEALLARIPGTRTGTPLLLTPEQIDTIGLVSRWLFMPKAKRRGEVVMLVDGGVCTERVGEAAAKLLRSKGGSDPGVESHEIEGAG